ncbi:hypothetical protein [Streptomyces sp. DSM 118878]
MDSTLLAALIAAMATAAGWIINSALGSRAELRRRQAEAQLTHVEQQLEQLYGPLLFLVKEGRSAWQDFCDTLGRNAVFLNGRPLSEEEKALWLFWVDHEFMPRNEAIQRLLSSKTHLIAGDQMPDSFMEFIAHYNAWRVTHLRWKEDGVPYSWHSKVNWPMKFEVDVIESYERLKNLQIQMAGLTRGMET